MAILFRLNITGAGLTEAEKLERLISYAHKFSYNIGFKRNTYHLWIDDDVEELGGKLEECTTDFGSIRAKIHRMLHEKVSKAILKFYGVLELPEPIEVEGYESVAVFDKIPATLVIYNKHYRRIYGCTIEFSTYTIPDWEIVLNSESFRDKLLNALGKTSHEGVELISCVVGFSKYAMKDIRDRVFFYYPERKTFLEDFFRTLNEETKEETTIAESIRKILRPYKIEFLTSVLDSFKEKLDELLDTFFKETGTILVHGSYALIASDEDTFSLLYEKLRDDFISSIKNEWPDEDKISHILKRWIEHKV